MLGRLTDENVPCGANPHRLVEGWNAGGNGSCQSYPDLYNSYVNNKAQAPAGLFSLLHTANTAQAHVESKLERMGLSLAKLAALTALVQNGESMPLGQLADRLACVKSNITQLVDRLESDGLVARKPDPNDRRSRLAVLTAAGRKAAQEGMKIQQETEQELFGGLTRDEAHHLAALMEKVTPRLG